MKKNVIIGIFSLSLLLLLFMLGAYLFCVFRKPSEPIIIYSTDKFVKKEEETKKDTLTLVATGDALIHSSIYFDALKDGIYDFTPQLEYIKPIVSKYDLAFYNQESILGGKELGYSTYPRFNTPNEFGDAMRDAGFNLVSLANNHSFDKGEKGVLNSLDYWSKSEVLYSGMNSSKEMQSEIPIKTKNNISYALLSYTALNNGLATPSGKEYLVNYYSDEKVKEDIDNIRDKVDLLMVSIHWGVEYSHVPSTQQKRIAQYLAESGVDIILGHHPHVLQPIEKIKDTVVIYSMGNFIASQIDVEKQTGVLVSMTITKEKGNISISHPEAQLTFTYNTSNWRKFKVIPYNQLEEKDLKNHEEAFTKQKSYLTAFDSNLVVK